MFLGINISLVGRLKAGGFTPATLFANGEAGVWYEPFDLTTLYQDDAGTTPVTTAGQTVGLMLDKSQGLTLGPELVTNGTFDTDLTGWTKDGDAATTIAHDTGGDGGRLLVNAATTYDGVSQEVSGLVIGRSYKLSVDFELGTSFWCHIRAGMFPTVQGVATGSLESLFVADATSISIQAGSGPSLGTLYIDNVSVRELPGFHATQPTAAARPEYLATPDRIDLDGVDDNMSIDFGSEFIGTVLQGTPNGVIHYDIDVSDGAWSLTQTPAYVPDGGEITGMVAVEGTMSAPDVASTKAYLQKNGAGDDFAGVTSMREWFRDRDDITAIYAGDWDTSLVTSFLNFSRLCSILTTLDVSNWDTSSVTDFGSFAYGCSSLTILDVSNWDTSSVTNFSFFAFNCSILTTLDVSNWDTSSVTDFGSFVRNCSSLITLDVSNWDTSSVTNFAFFARGCSSLTTVTVNGGTGNPFADSPCTNYTSAFSNTNLTQQSIDDILVEIELAGTSDGTFNQSGGSAPSATGEAAVTALRSRGWTVTVTGGF